MIHARVLGVVAAIALSTACKTAQQTGDVSEVMNNQQPSSPHHAICDQKGREAGAQFALPGKRRQAYEAAYGQCIAQMNAGGGGNNNGGGGNNNGGGNNSGGGNSGVLIVSINGRDSCRLQLADGANWPFNLYTFHPARTLAKRIAQQGVKADVLHVCLFASDFRLTEENMRLIAIHRVNGQLDFIGDALLPARRRFVHDLPDMVAEKATGRPVIIIGHSYGGWTAMYTALRSAGKFKTAALFTLDPISPNDCTAVRFIGGSPECRKFPTDIQPNQVRSVTPLWVNFFQRQGPIASNQAPGGLNSYHNLNNSACAHRYVGANRGVWDIIMAGAVARATSAGNGGVEGRLLPFDGEPDAGEEGECGNFADSGTPWADPGD